MNRLGARPAYLALLVVDWPRVVGPAGSAARGSPRQSAFRRLRIGFWSCQCRAAQDSGSTARRSTTSRSKVSFSFARGMAGPVRWLGRELVVSDDGRHRQRIAPAAGRHLSRRRTGHVHYGSCRCTAATRAASTSGSSPSGHRARNSRDRRATRCEFRLKRTIVTSWSRPRASQSEPRHPHGAELGPSSPARPSGNEVEMMANTSYYGSGLRIDRISFKLLPSVRAAWADLLVASRHALRGRRRRARLARAVDVDQGLYLPAALRVRLSS